MAQRQARTRQHEAGVAGRHLDRDPGADADPGAGRDQLGLDRAQVEARVAVVGAGRNSGIRAQAGEAQLHAASVSAAQPRSAEAPLALTAKSAKRCAIAAGIRAETRTPSARSVRSMLPASS